MMNENNIKTNLEDVCRTCLSYSRKLRSIKTPKMKQILEYCTGSKVPFENNVPSAVCMKCHRLLLMFYSFKKKFEKNETLWKMQTPKKKDILDIAVCEANILEPNNLEQPSTNEEQKCATRRSPRNNKQKSSPRTVTKKDINVKETMKLDIDVPPLVPIESTKIKQVEDIIDRNILPKLLGEPPPLVPLKFLGNEPGLTNIIENFDAPCTCSTCQKTFADVLAFKEHKATNACQRVDLQCNICTKKCADRKRLINHLKSHVARNEYTCKVCSKGYPNPSTFLVHMRSHTGERPFKCEICGKGFSRWAGVISHKAVHDEHKRFNCNVCGKMFKTVSNLERHKIVHTGIMPYCCSYCGKTFSQSENLQLHIRTYHTRELPYLCSECGKGFVSLARLNRHTWVHSGHRPYKCASCPKAYSNSNDLKNHRRTNHENGEYQKPFSCTTCSRRFFHKCRLQKHLKTHEKPYVCEHCAKNFSSEKVLIKHLESKHASSAIENSQ